MSNYSQAVHYMIQRIWLAWIDKEYQTDDWSEVVHEELDYYVSNMYNHEVDDIIVSYGLTKALQEYDNHFGDCPKNSHALLYVILMDPVREKVGQRIENMKTIAKRRAVWNEEKKHLEFFD